MTDKRDHRALPTARPRLPSRLDDQFAAMQTITGTLCDTPNDVDSTGRLGSHRGRTAVPTGRSRTQPDPTGNDPCASSLMRGQSGNGGRRLDRPLPSLGGRSGYEIRRSTYRMA